MPEDGIHLDARRKAEGALPPRRTRFLLSGAAVLLYVAAFLPVYSVAGRFTDELALLPLFVIAYLFGLRGGLIAGLSAVPVNVGLLLLASGGEQSGFMGALFWVSHAALLLIGGAIGALADASRQLRQEIATRRQVELGHQSSRIQIEALRGTAATLNSSLDFDEVIERILENVGKVVPHVVADVMLIEGGRARVVRRDTPDPALKGKGGGEGFEVQKTPTFKAMVLSRMPVIVPDTRASRAWTPREQTGWVRSYLGAPIVLDDEVIGFINLNSPEPDSFTDDQALVLQAFAHQAAVALKNARLYSDLEARNRELDAFNHTIAHDLKAPLNLIAGYAGLLKDPVHDKLPDYQEYLDAIRDSAFKMGQMIEKLLWLSRMTNASQAATPVEMAEAARHAQTRFRQDIEGRGIAVEIQPDLPMAMGNDIWIEEVFANLIGNAIKYMREDDPAPRIVICGKKREGAAYFEVRDNGPGISPQDQGHLFEMFTRFHSREADGLGLGLSIVHHMVTQLGGEVGVESAPGEGSTFWFTLPLPE